MTTKFLPPKQRRRDPELDHKKRLESMGRVYHKPIGAQIVITAVMEDDGTPMFGVVNTPDGEKSVFIPVKVANRIRPNTYLDDVVNAKLVPNFENQREKQPYMAVHCDMPEPEIEPSSDG